MVSKLYTSSKITKIIIHMKYTGIIISLIAGITTLLFAYMLSNSYTYKYKAQQTINVTGNAKKDFESDLVKWSAGYSRKSFQLEEASELLNKDRLLISKFLQDKGIDKNEIVFDAVSIVRDFNYHTDERGNSYNTFAGYSLRQNVHIESKDLDKVENVSREISSLISQGIELESNAPNYYYSKLEDLKLALIAEASKNAKARAHHIAEESGSTLGKLLKADLGVFQITGQNDNEEFSHGGVFNTSSRAKTANITVRVSYGQ